MRHHFSRLLLPVIMALFLLAGSLSLPGSVHAQQSIPDELLIKYEDGVNAFQKRQIKEANDLEAEPMKQNALRKENIEQVQLEGSTTPAEREEIIETSSDVCPDKRRPCDDKGSSR